ncbi:MAG: hypothetical protein J3R72DRAFT_122924 [Linnemannia gamsii]|nr:MAG: hypothetical protein J3R72DRAFT_122924 [Linnemannia gamsii]
MQFSNNARDTLDDTSLSSRGSQGHCRSLSNPTSPVRLQHTANDDRNNASGSDRRNLQRQRRCINPFAQFFRNDDPPSAADAASLENNYRMLPLLIGCIIPVSILINVPSITSPWVGLGSYNETLQDWNDPEVLEIPHWLNGIIILALIMAIICNICVLFRFLERHVYHSVVLSLVTATIQDVLCIGAVVPFGILYPPSKGYVYLEGFWTMLASILFSFLATILISIDLHRTPNFRLQGSGVTHKQRLLIAEAMTLCFYLAIGALVFIYLEKWTFLDAMFFVMVTITTIGFGDRVPQTTGGRIFVVVYAAGGIVLLALAVNAIRYVILEDLHRRFAIRSKERKASRDARRQERRDQRVHQEEQRQRLQEAMERFQQMEVSVSPAGSGTSMPSGTPRANPNLGDTASDSHYFTHFPRYFNVTNRNQMRLPSIFTRNTSGSEPNTAEKIDTRRYSESDMTLADRPSQDAIEMLRIPGSNTSREVRAGADDANGASSQTQTGGTSWRNPYIIDDDLLRYATIYPSQTYDSGRSNSWLNRLWFFRRAPIQETMPPATLEEQREVDKRQAYRESMKEYQRRLRFSAAMFLTFWLVGAIIFTFVESWDFGSSVYFVFIAFSTIGYGDFVPRTMAGRSIFLVYCLVGVVTLTSLASLISEVLSKSMRKHVVETQLRRAEHLEALGDERGGHQGDDVDLEPGASQGETDETGSHGEGVSGTDEVTTNAAPEDNTCHGTLQNLVKVSKSFDDMLRKILALEYKDDERRVITGNESEPSSPSLPVNPNPGAIVSYLEAQEDESEPSFLSPSISRDITSTSSIHRHSLRPMMHNRRHSHDPLFGGTYHGAGSPPQSESSYPLKIIAWPTTGTPSDAIQLHKEHSRSRSQASTPPPGLLQVPRPIPTSVSTSQHAKNSMITIPAVQWQSMIEYSKRFKALTLACEQALQKVAEWEASEKRLRQKRCDARIRQKHRIDERRRRLERLKGSRGAVDDEMTDEEEELEELDEWDEEGSADDEDDEDLDNQRAQVAAKLLGPLPANPRTLSSPGRTRRPSMSSKGHQSRHRGTGTDPHDLQQPSVPLARTLHTHLRDHLHPKPKDGHKAQQAHRHHQGVGQSRIERVMGTRSSEPLEAMIPYRSESPEPMEPPIALSAMARSPGEEVNTRSPPSSSARSDQRLLSSLTQPTSPD